jgi:hypothetical protein
MSQQIIGSSQIAVFIGITVLIAIATRLKVRGPAAPHSGSDRKVFLANGSLT